MSEEINDNHFFKVPRLHFNPYDLLGVRRSAGLDCDAKFPAAFGTEVMDISISNEIRILSRDQSSFPSDAHTRYRLGD